MSAQTTTVDSPTGTPPRGLSLLAALSGFLVVGILIFFIPYAQGYVGERRTLAETLKLMWGYEQWEHCWLVVPALAFIIYLQRKDLARLPLQGTAWGLLPLVASLTAYWAGYRVENYYIGFFAIHLLIGGLILWLAGWRWFFTLFFAFAFLTFAWPLYFLENSITFPLRMIMSKTSVAVLNFIGIPVVLNGTGILSAPEVHTGTPAGQRFSVDVADPCSGIRSLFALMMVSALYGHFTLKTWWQKLLLFASSVPLAVLGNLFRILTLTIGTMAFGSEFAIGKDALDDPSWFHMGAGYVVFAVALGGMIGVSWLLKQAANWHTLVAKWKTALHPPAPLPHPTSNVQHPTSSSLPKTPPPRRTDEY